MKFKLLESVDQIRIYRDDWNLLASRCGDNPFHSWEWNYHWLRFLGGEGHPFVVVLLDDDSRWRGIIPLFVEQNASKLKRRLRLIGSGKACADYTGIISAPEDFVKVADDFSRLLYRGLHEEDFWGPVDEVELDGLAQQSSNSTYLLDRMMVEGFEVDTESLEGTWEVRFAEDWDQFRSTLRQSTKRKVNKAMRKLDSGDFWVRSSRDGSFDDMWRSFVQLHQLRRNTLAQPGCFNDSNFHDFLVNVAQDLAERDRAEILNVIYKEKAIASMLLFYNSTTAMMYQTGMDPAFEQFQPGHMMVTVAIRNSIEHGLRSFDFLRGDEPYKATWNAQRKQLVKAHLIPDQLIPLVKHRVWQSTKSVKNYFKNVLGTS